MALYLNRDAVIQCSHGGRLQLGGPTQDVVVAGGSPVVTEQDLMTGSIVGCPQVGSGVTPCTAIVGVQAGRARGIDAAGQVLMTDALSSVTNGSPPGQCSVMHPGGSRMQTLSAGEMWGASEEPSPEWTLENLRWNRESARQGKMVSLLADASGVPDGTPVVAEILEFDSDGRHDLVVELHGTVEGSSLRIDWPFRYVRDEDEVNQGRDGEVGGDDYAHPEYFFRLRVLGSCFGEEQESGLLRFQSHVEISRRFANGRPAAGQRFEIVLPDGRVEEGELDDEGLCRIDDVPPGTYRIRWIAPGS